MSKQDLPPIPDQATFLETLSSQSIGVALIQSFEGYDIGDHAPLSMQYLLQQYYLYPSHNGNPPFTLSSPREDHPIAPWSMSTRTHFSGSPVTTIESTPDSPYINPDDLNMAPEIVTATHSHHWDMTTDAIHDMCFAFDDSNSPTGYWYDKQEQFARKSKSKPKLNQMISYDQVHRLLQFQPDRWGTGARIELWQLTQLSKSNKPTYRLESGYTLEGLSLVDYLAFLSLDPQIFSKITSGRISLTE